MEKLTYVQALSMVLELQEVANNGVLFDKIEQLKNSLDKKAKSDKECLSPKQIENRKIKFEIIEALALYTEPVQIKEIEELGHYSNQKISQLMKQLVDENQVKRVAEKKVTKFILA